MLFVFIVNPKAEPVATTAATDATVSSGASGIIGGKYVPPNQRGGEGKRGESLPSRHGRDGKCFHIASDLLNSKTLFHFR